MVSFEQVWEALGNRPFRPFRLILKDGRVWSVTRPLQAAAAQGRHDMIVSIEGRTKRIKFDCIERLQYVQAQVA